MTARPIATRWWRSRGASAPQIVYLANPDNPSGRFISRRRDRGASTRRCPHDTLLLLDEAYADFVDEDELLPRSFEDRLIRLRTFSKAYGMAGARIGYALATESNVRTFQKIRLHYGINRNAQIGALASLGDDEFRRYVVDGDRRSRATTTTGWHVRWAAAISSRTRTSSASTWRRPQRATRVMDELLARGVWIRKPGAPPLDRLHAGERRNRADAPQPLSDALRAVLAEVFALDGEVRDRLGRAREPRVARACALDRFRPTTSSSRSATSSATDRIRTSASPLLRERCRHAVLGNHDLAAVENFGVENFNHAARAAIGWTQGVLDEASRAWLNALPYELRFPDFLLVHGAPVNYFEYILDKSAAARAFDATDAPIVFVGHTHIAEYWTLRRQTAASGTSTCSTAAS